MGLRISKEKINLALERIHDQNILDSILDTGILSRKHETVCTFELDRVPKELLTALIEHADLGKGQCKTIQKFLYYSSDQVSLAEARNIVIHSPKGLYESLVPLISEGVKKPFVIEYMGIKIPVTPRINHQKNYMGEGYFCSIQIIVKPANTKFEISILEANYSTENFRDEDNNKISFTLGSILEDLKLSTSTNFDFETYEMDCLRASHLSEKSAGKMYLCKEGNILLRKIDFDWFKTVEATKLESDEKMILENNLEPEESSHYYSSNESSLDNPIPFLRVFSLSRKVYGYAYLKGMKPYLYDKELINKLIIDDQKKELLKKVLTSDLSFKDVVSNKSQGLICLAYGSSGTGKTLTAEVFSEYLEKPLYHLEFSELGTDLNEIEERLQKIFFRVTRWSAILLFDECDIFFSQRDSDLQRSSLVGIFLRLLDYYNGLMFLTTNRPEVIDTAFKSRITLSIEYQDLDDKQREQIFRVLLNIKNSISLKEISSKELNGRQIRNICKLALSFYNGRITEKNLLELAEYQI